jgi:hypothetical protein
MTIRGMARVAALVTVVLVAPAHGVDLETAKKMAAACEAKAVQEGWKMNVAVVDAGADLVVFQRMDGAFLGSIEIARMKAESRACLQPEQNGRGPCPARFAGTAWSAISAPAWRIGGRRRSTVRSDRVRS